MIKLKLKYLSTKFPKMPTHFWCEECDAWQLLEVVHLAEKLYNPEIDETYYNDIDFSEIRCDVCYINIDETLFPKEAIKELVQRAWDKLY